MVVHFCLSRGEPRPLEPTLAFSPVLGLVWGFLSQEKKIPGKIK